MTAKEAYEIDRQRQPNYHDGKLRPPYDKLDDLTKWTWERNPTPRKWN